MNFSFGFLAGNTSTNSTCFDNETLANNHQEAETAGSLAYLNVGGGVDSFGSKDLFGEVDFSNMSGEFFANAQESETAGSIAYSDFGGVSLGDCGASVSADAGFSSDCGSFSSVC